MTPHLRAQAPAMSFPEESGTIRYIKGNAPFRHISFLHLTFSHRVARPIARLRPSKPCVSHSRCYAFSQQHRINIVVCLETFNTIARYVTKIYRNNNIMCDCIEVKEYKNQTESCWIILIPRLIETYVWNLVSDSWQIIGSSPLTSVSNWDLIRTMKYHRRIFETPHF